MQDWRAALDFLAGERPVGGAEGEREGDALLPGGDLLAAEDVEELDALRGWECAVRGRSSRCAPRARLRPRPRPGRAPRPDARRASKAAVQRGGADEQVEIQLGRARRMRDVISLADGGADFAHDRREHSPSRIFAARFSAKNGFGGRLDRHLPADAGGLEATTPSTPLSWSRSSSDRIASTLRSSGSASSGSAGPDARGGFGRKTLLISKSGDFGTPCARFVRLTPSRPGSSDTRSRFSSRRIVFWTASGSARVQGETRARRPRRRRNSSPPRAPARQPAPRSTAARRAAGATRRPGKRPAFGDFVVAVDADDFLDQVNLAVHVHGAEGRARGRSRGRRPRRAHGRRAGPAQDAGRRRKPRRSRMARAMSGATAAPRTRFIRAKRSVTAFG